MCVFLDVLTTDEQVVYGQLAQVVLAADGSLHDKERTFRDRAVRELRFDSLRTFQPTGMSSSPRERSEWQPAAGHC